MKIFPGILAYNENKMGKICNVGPVVGIKNIDKVL
jgi:hypothetical protein